MDYLDKKKSISYLEKIEKTTRSKFEEIKQENYNTNTKGYDLEKTLCAFYSSYLSNGYDFFVRSPILDVNLRVETLFKRKNEFDVIATYKSSLPRHVYKIKDTDFVPYDSVAFITEVKQTLTKSNLNKDLEKFRLLDQLEFGNRFKYLSFPYLRQNVERVLFYCEKKARQSSIVDLLNCPKFNKCWDIITILNEDIIFTNTTNYVAKSIMKRDRWGIEYNFPMVKTILYATYPSPYMVNSWDLILNFLRSSLIDNECD